ncbi:MAG: ABC transporter ATP-binding protein [Alphaproteobacteria bacterium]|nr:ABC transporter ATP-binding protein [Alphaproteobacteria bacterium]MCB9985332.1 ABC transporter ATP-binding protein [Micavibrio sp.]
MNTYAEDYIPKVTRRDIGRFARHYWSRGRGHGLLAVLLLGLSVGVDIFYPVFSGQLVDKVSTLDPAEDGVLSIVLWSFACLMSVQIIHSWSWAVAMWFWDKFVARVLHDVLTDATAKVQRFSTDWHVNSFAGATVRKITRGMWSFDIFSNTIFMGFFPSVIIGIGMVIMLIIQVPVVGWFALPMVVLFVIVTVTLAIKIGMPKFRKSAEQDTLVGATLADTMTAISTVKSFAGESREDLNFGAVAKEWHRRVIDAWLTHVAIDFVRTNIRIVMMAGMLGLVIWLWYKGEATPGDVTLSITAFFIIGGYLRDIGRHTTELMKASSEIADVVGFWKREDDILDAPNATILSVPEKGKGAEITFDRVSFRYQEGDRPIYQSLSVEIRAGEKIALVGASGSGKSTFVKLIQRLYDIQSGEIRIEGQNIAQVTQESLRSSIALVPQDPVLFHRSLAENIAYGKINASIDEIRGAAREAYAAEFIEGLTQGYLTLVGERGVKLSGGERQRVAIARALLADCPVLILDEATSSLDSVSEHYIQKALERLMIGRTTITIAHRLATIQKADRILVFESGQIVEQGTHEGLLKNPDSVYRRLYDIQALDLRPGYS